MRSARLLALLLALPALTVPAHGGPTIIIGPGGVGLSLGRGPLSGSVYFGSYGPTLYAPTAYTTSYYGSPVYASPVRSPQPIVILQPVINVQPTPAPVPEPTTELRDEDFPDKIIIRPKQRTVRVPAPDRPIQPAPAPAPILDDPPVAPPARPQAGPPPLPREPAPQEPAGPWWPQLPDIPDRPALRPRDPAAPPAQQQIDLGKQAFADPLREIARAEQRFLRAIAADPKLALPHFYLAQAQFALGKYREAVASIHAGLRLDPTWPIGGFKARELYGPNGEAFIEHMQALEEALTRRPEDPVLLFLYAYQLWFDGKQPQAVRFFQRVLPLVAEPRFVQLFLQANAGRVVAR